MLVIDAHSHLGYWPRFYIPDIRVKTLLSCMDELKIDMMLATSHYMMCGEIDLGIEQSIKAYEESGGRIRCYMYYDPHFDFHTCDILRSYMSSPAFVGIKIHPSMARIYADDNRYCLAWNWARQTGVPILAHSWDYSDTNPAQKYSFPSKFERYLREYPEVKLIFGHAGGRFDGHMATIALVRGYSNAYVDLSGDSYGFRFIEWLTSKIPNDRILFGTDVTWVDPRTHFARILKADVSSTTKEMIFGKNAVEVFGIKLDG